MPGRDVDWAGMRDCRAKAGWRGGELDEGGCGGGCGGAGEKGAHFVVLVLKEGFI